MKFKAQVLVTYELETGSKDSAYNALYYDTEFPIFPHTIGSCVDTEIVLIEEVA
jgi:hypothetical protein